MRDWLSHRVLINSLDWSQYGRNGKCCKSHNNFAYTRNINVYMMLKFFSMFCSIFPKMTHLNKCAPIVNRKRFGFRNSFLMSAIGSCYRNFRPTNVTDFDHDKSMDVFVKIEWYTTGVRICWLIYLYSLSQLRNHSSSNSRSRYPFKANHYDHITR